MSDLYENFRAALAELLQQKRYNQTEAAEKAGLKVQHFNKIFKGTIKGTEPLRRQIAARLGAPSYEDMVLRGSKADMVEVRCPDWCRPLVPRVAQLRPAEQELLRKHIESTLEMLEEVRGPTRKTKRSRAK